MKIKDDRLTFYSEMIDDRTEDGIPADGSKAHISCTVRSRHSRKFDGGPVWLLQYAYASGRMILCGTGQSAKESEYISCQLHYIRY